MMMVRDAMRVIMIVVMPVVMVMVVMADTADVNVVRLIRKATQQEPAAQSRNQQTADEAEQSLDLLRFQAGKLQNSSHQNYRTGVGNGDDEAEQHGVPSSAPFADQIGCDQC